jgi:monofunctional biosynthetic peptidoglycan transglycosylase
MWVRCKRRRRWIWRLLILGLTVFSSFALYVVLTWPDVTALAESMPEATAFIERARSRGVDVDWRWVPYDRISPELKKSVLVAEDFSFFSHKGFDTHEIKIAAREAVQGKRVRGASTITQQLAKNLWLSPSRSPLRKLKELILTRQLERSLSKHRILELYLNVVQFGPDVYGAEAAARRYFGIPAGELKREQAARLAASLPRPATWYPGVSSRGYNRSVTRILARMEQADWLDRLL